MQALWRLLTAPFVNSTVLLRVNALQHDLLELRLEWAEVSERLASFAKRQAKRDSDIVRRELSTETARDPNVPNRKAELRRKIFGHLRPPEVKRESVN